MFDRSKLPEKVRIAIQELEDLAKEAEARARGELTHARLLELVDYDKVTGLFTWKEGKNQGKQAGWSSDQGYIYLTLEGTKYQAHRIAWFYVHGVWPTYEIDHKDRIRDHNWIDNLRDVTHQVNSENRGPIDEPVNQGTA